MCISALFMVAKTWKQFKCPLMTNWIKTKWYIYRLEYYPATRKDEILPFAKKTWMDLKSIMLNKVSQTKKG